MFSVGLRVKGVEVTSRFPWDIGIVLFMAFPETMNNVGVPEAFRKIAEDPFFDLIEMHIVPRDVWRRVRKVIDQTGVRVAAALQLHVFKEKLNINSPDEEGRKRSVNRIKELIEEAHARELDTVALCSGPYPGKKDEEKAMKALIESLKEICSYAKERGMRVLLESFDRHHDKKLLIGPLKDAARVIREVRKEYDNIGLLWDLSHAPLLNEKPEDLKDYTDILWHIHVGCGKKVNERLLDTHPVFYTPGAINDVNDVMRLIKTLIEIGYKGAFTLEIKPEEHQTSLEIINVGKGVLVHAYSMYLIERLK